MPFHPKILQQVAEEIDPECLMVPAPPSPMNAYDKLSNAHFMNEKGEIVTLPRVNHRFTLNFGFDGCTTYCVDTNPALATMAPDWQHIVINTLPETQGAYPQFRSDFRKDIEKDPLGNQSYRVPNVTVLFPVAQVNGKWQLSNKAAVDDQLALGLIANPSNARAHNPSILTFDDQGCQTGKFEASQIANKTFQLKQGCSR